MRWNSRVAKRLKVGKVCCPGVSLCCYGNEKGRQDGSHDRKCHKDSDDTAMTVPATPKGRSHETATKKPHEGHEHSTVCNQTSRLVYDSVKRVCTKEEARIKILTKNCSYIAVQKPSD